MALQLRALTGASTYSHDPQPDIKIARTPIMDEDGGKAIGYKETWTIEGTLVGSGIADISGQIVDLEAAYASPTSLRLYDTVLAANRRSLVGASARDGIVITGPSYPQGNKAEYASKRRYNITGYGDFYDGSQFGGDPQILWYEETTDYSYDQHGKYTRTISGRLRTKDGVSASGKFASITPAIVAGTNRIRYNRRSNTDDDELTFSFMDVEYWIPWPVGVTGGQAIASRTLGAYGQLKISVHGQFTGAGAFAAAEANKLTLPQYLTIQESWDINAYDGSVSFRFDYVDLVTSALDLIAFNETTTMEFSSQDFVILEALDGAIPERQQTVVTPARARQSGSAVALSAFWAFPAPLWGTVPLKPPKVQSKSGPDLMPNGGFSNYRTSWSYDFEFATNPTFHDPNTT